MKISEKQVPALMITPEVAPVVSGNFNDIKKFLIAWREEVKSLKLSEDTMEAVRTIKKKAIQFRNSLTDIETRIKKFYFNDPKSVFSAQMDELKAIVANVEKDADVFLGKEEEERIAQVNEVLNYYKGKFQEKYKLGELYFSRVEYKKSYYNKTAEEKERKDDLEGQFKALKKEEDAYKGNIKLINAACDDPRLNFDMYVRNLKDDVSISSILEAIAEEKERLARLDNLPDGATATITSSSVSTPVIAETLTILGVARNLDFTTDFPGEDKKIVIEVTYPCDVGDSLTELFNSLKQFGIKIRRVQKEEIIF